MKSGSGGMKNYYRGQGGAGWAIADEQRGSGMDGHGRPGWASRHAIPPDDSTRQTDRMKMMAMVSPFCAQ